MSFSMENIHRASVRPHLIVNWVYAFPLHAYTHTTISELNQIPGNKNNIKAIACVYLLYNIPTFYLIVHIYKLIGNNIAINRCFSGKVNTLNNCIWCIGRLVRRLFEINTHNIGQIFRINILCFDNTYR